MRMTLALALALTLSEAVGCGRVPSEGVGGGGGCDVVIQMSNLEVLPPGRGLLEPCRPGHGMSKKPSAHLMFANTQEGVQIDSRFCDDHDPDFALKFLPRSPAAQRASLARHLAPRQHVAWVLVALAHGCPLLTSSIVVDAISRRCLRHSLATLFHNPEIARVVRGLEIVEMHPLIGGPLHTESSRHAHTHMAAGLRVSTKMAAPLFHSLALSVSPSLALHFFFSTRARQRAWWPAPR